MSFSEERDITGFQATKLNNEFLILSVTNISYSPIRLKSIGVFPLVDVASFSGLKKKEERKALEKCVIYEYVGFLFSLTSLDCIQK